ncbi:hypothetical protein GEOBRER4_n2471 [Citrifermentans bremense]|uniref:Uncharacterized protein n=1 Tax=Citrifermentans bremense TaxID=60035 RepID=A0A7R7IZA2_9BACT|nr:hypothetical protein GEOBRER4_n2471 [Citrifermentans bremense]
MFAAGLPLLLSRDLVQGKVLENCRKCNSGHITIALNRRYSPQTLRKNGQT